MNQTTDTNVQQNLTQQLAQAQKKVAYLERIIENSYDGIYITDHNGLTLQVNRAFERISGLPRGVMVGRYMVDMVREGLFAGYVTDEVVRQKKPVTINQTVNQNRNLIVTGSPVFDQNGNVDMVITNVRDISELVALERELKRSKRASKHYQTVLFGNLRAPDVVCESEAMKSVLRLADRVATKDSSVLILGETGVGKEVLARYIHQNSRRRDSNYIKVNCGAVPKNLLESELFGYGPNALPGGNPKGKAGRFELADEGTLFLDEIGALPLDLQSSLLRVLQDGVVSRVGDTESRRVNVRIITATTCALDEMVRQGTFRGDLYDRLNIISIHIPPLRERPEEISSIAELFLERLNTKYGERKVMTSRFIQRLEGLSWPDNIREMSHFIERQFALSEGDILDTFITLGQAKEATRSKVSVDGIMPLDDAVQEVTATLLHRAMRQGGTTYKAAALLGMSQPTFYRKYKALNGNNKT